MGVGDWILLGVVVVNLLLFVFVFLIKENKKVNIKEDLNNFKIENSQITNNAITSLGTILTSSNDTARKNQNEKIDFLISSLTSSFKTLNESVNTSTVQNENRMENMRKSLDTTFVNLQNENTKKLDNIRNTVNERLKELQEFVVNSINNSNIQTEQKLENIRNTVEKSITKLQDENSKKLDEMRNVVDEKLQKTLEDRLAKSFNVVSERLEQVYKGLGEMQTLAAGVGDLKKVLSNVKTRGTLGEIQLEGILSQILAPEQYEKNVITKKGSSDPVEFAVKLPGDNNNTVYLPIDAKFPLSDYQALNDSYDSGNTEDIKSYKKNLINKIKFEAKKIHDKYIDVPNTTEFGIMFLPIEGLYAEVINSGVVETLQRDYKINIAGPTTMAALLNSLQMGFKTLAIQKRSSEVWRILGAVKTEFTTFGETLEKAQKKLSQAGEDLDKLIGVRTRQIQRKLSSISDIPELETKVILELDE